MNLKASTYLKPLQSVIEKTGANFIQVCHLVELKLLLDNRKANPNSANTKDPNNTLIRQSLLFIFVGTMLSLMIIKLNDIFMISLLNHVYLMVMVSITLMAEYSVSLFDTRDNNLIIPLPANGQTLGWARVIHILIYLLLLSFSLMLPSVITLGFKFGVASALLMVISALFNTLFTLFFTIFIYLGLMKFTSGDKLKDMMMYIQVGLSIVIMIGYQLVPRYLMPVDGAQVLIQTKWYFLLIPPIWFSMLTSVFYNHQIINTIGSTMALIVPVVSMIFIGKKLFYGFESKLVQLSSGDVSNAKTNSDKMQKDNSIWQKINELILGIPKNELPVFRLMWKLVGRERLFKQSILPMLAYIIVLPLISVFTNNNMGNLGNKYLTFLYFTIMTTSMIPIIISIGSNAHTSWIFHTLPHLKPSAIFSNAVKAAMARFFIPVFLLMALPLFYYKGPIAVVDIITVFIFNYLVAIAILYFQIPYMPFSQSKAVSQGGKTALRMMLIVFIALPLGFLHAYLSGKNGWFGLLLVALFLPLLLLFDKKWFPQKITWKMVEISNKA